MNVLIVDDQPVNLKLLHATLEAEGHSVAEAVDGVEALEFLAKQRTDAVISDILMPRMDGYRLCQEVRKRDELRDLPFIMYTSTYVSPGDEKFSLDLGADLFLRKPAPSKQIIEALHQVTSEHRKPRTLLSSAIPESAVMKEYNERLVAKLEQKNLELANALEELNKQRRQQELILNSAGEGIHGLDLNGNILFTNPKGAELLGWKAEELRGKPSHATVHHTKSDGSQYPVESCPIYGSMSRGGTCRVTNDVFWRKDGTSFSVDYVSAPIKDEQGRIAGSIVTFKDITDQVMAEARQELQAEQYRLLFITNPNPMWVFDTKTLGILAVNEAAIAQYGYSRDEFLQLTLPDLRPPEDVPKLKNSLSPADSPAHSSGRLRHVKKDGSVVLVEIYSGPVIWEGTAARITTAIDVTEQQRADERLREQADIINRARDAVIIRDFESDKVVFWNSGAEQLYDWTAAEAIGRPLGELIFAEVNDRADLLDKLLSTGEYHGEIKHRSRDGREVIVDSRTTLIRNDDGSPRSVLGINTDITEKTKLETQLLRSQRLESIGTLASGVAHDLNNILTPILMCAETLRRHAESEDIRSASAIIDESARRGANVVKQVLTFARGIEGERVTIDPRHLMQEMVDIARKTFPKSIAIRARYPEELWAIQADPTQLHQVLLNLSVNARDAMPGGGSLVFAAENFTVDENFAAMTPDAKPGPYLVLDITDTGSGMSRATIDKVFDPFFTTKEAGKGTGLGLSTVLGIVKSHGGFISVYSEPSKGTTFKIFLPAVMTDEDLQKTRPAVAAAIRGNGEQILVVDDEPNILEVTKMILEKHNYGVLLAHDGPEALALFAQQMHSISGILTDMSLPYLHGIALIRALIKMKPNIPIIASTGQGDQSGQAELQSLGVQTFLTKPYNTEKLLAAVHDSLQSQEPVCSEV